mgnify:CR=1 FL=1|tara:strand:+ start:625 stop:1935 length:1311 start_codon:yes stop_codon:yes gene_type:complete
MKDKNQKLYSEAIKIIPNGTMLFSKKPEIYLPGKWPTYYSKAKKAYVWDLEKKKYLDMYFGVGQNTLGYANMEVDNAVIKSNRNGNMCSLNSDQDVKLAKKLIKIHPWAGFARFAKSGGEANAVSIRYARAISKKDKIAICGYHGWHDWYLAANLKSKKKLNDHHIQELKVDGVPKALKNTVYPFRMNNFNDLNKIKKIKGLGVIKMEVFREKKPNLKFLKNIRKHCDKNNIVLIFDECTSGFRETYGGIHKNYKIYPDLLMLGKAMGNGYPITSILGRKKFINKVSNCFVSSTFWTERSGAVAACKTIEIMKRDKTYSKIKKIGKNVKKIWQELSSKHKLKIKIYGLDSIPCFQFLYKNHLAYKTFLTQQMLKKRILATTQIYISIAHEKKHLQNYKNNLDKIFKLISEFEHNNVPINSFLESKVSEVGFKRYTN